MSSSRHKRSSILKKRASIDPASLEGSPSETTATSKVIKRIGFKPKKSVKEFFASEETATIWCNSYELSTDGTPPCIAAADVSALKEASKVECPAETGECPTSNKENRLSAGELRASFGDSSSIWNLSISVSEEERRRIKAENSVLNTTDRLTQDPISLPRPVLRQKQLEVYEDSNAMDISPVKSDGNISSPKKVLYHHPKQNMFVTIVNEARSVQSPNDSEINFFGPQGNQPAPQESLSSKILFQTSSANNQWRNKSIQTEPRPSMAANMRSTAVNADLSAGWSSHVAATEPFGQRLTFGNSQFEISEAWNSHPAAALKLKMLQQGKISMVFDPRLSDGGGGEDIDTTLAITQTVAKMLGPGSKTTSLENTRIMEAEAMDVTKVKENYTDEPMDTSVNMMELADDATISDVHIPTNALTRARPSFVPSSAPMDESDCQSPGEIVSISGHRRKPKQRDTILKTVPIESIEPEPDSLLLRAGPSHEPSPRKPNQSTNRQTILHDEKIVEDNLLGVPQIEVKTPPKSTMRKTVYNSNMEQSPVVDRSVKRDQNNLFMVEPIKLDLPELIFGENSIGLELTTNNETSRPKVHRMPPRNLKLEFGAMKPASESGKIVTNEDRISTIVIDSPEPQMEPKRRTVNGAADISLDKELLNDCNSSENIPSRKTNFQNLDVSVEKSAENTPDYKRGTIFTNAMIDESVNQLEEPSKLPRATIFYNEALNQTRAESLEDLRSTGKSRKTIQQNDAMECVSPDLGSRVNQSKKSRMTNFVLGEMDQSQSRDLVVESKPRLTTATVQDMDETVCQLQKETSTKKIGLTTRRTDHHNLDVSMDSPQSFNKRETISTNKPFDHQPLLDPQKSRGTIFFNDQLEQTRLEPRSGSLEDLRMYGQARRTIERTKSEGACSEVLNSDKPHSARKSNYLLGEMDQSRIPSPIGNLNPRRTADGNRPVDETSSRSSIVSTAPVDTGKHRATINYNIDMDQSSCSRKSVLPEVPRQKFRQTIIGRESMDQTLVDRQVELQQVAQEIPQRRTLVGTKTRQTITGRQSMDETLIDRHVELQQEPQLLSETHMEETGVVPENLRKSRSVSDVVFQKSRLTSHHELHMEETKILQDDSYTALPSPKSFARETNSFARIMEQKDCTALQNRQSVLTEMNMDETNRNVMIEDSHINESIRQSQIHQSQSKFFGNNAVDSRHTSYAINKMNESASPTAKLETILLERSRLCTEMNGPSVPRQTIYQQVEMDETRYVTPPQNSDLPLRGSIIHSPTNTSRRTLIAEQTIDETVPVSELIKQSNITIPGTYQEFSTVRHTTYERDPMDETTLALQEICVTQKENCVQSPNMPSADVLQLRQTVNAEQDMERTAIHSNDQSIIQAPQRSLVKSLNLGQTFPNHPNMELTVGAMIDNDDDDQDANGSVCAEPNVSMNRQSAEQSKNGIIPTATTSFNHHNQQFEESKPHRKTILIPEDMEQSLELDTSGLTPLQEKSPPSRRTIVHPDNIAEESIRFAIKAEQSESTLNVASPTYALQEQTKQDFSFAVPQLPDDCVLRSAAPIPSYKTNPTFQTAPHLAQPEFANYSITDPCASIRKTIAVDNLSEISGLELSNCQPTRSIGVIGAPPGDVCSLTLKEVTEPAIVQPAPVAVSVIQETPKKASMIPVRKNRGSIFDRQSMDLDESGIAPIVSQEQPEQSEPDPPMTEIHDPDPDDEIVIKNEPIVDSSDDEFYDANNDPVNEQNDEHDDCVYVTKEAVQPKRFSERGKLKFVEAVEKDHTQATILDHTSAECRTLKFIDVDDLEQTTQKRQLSRISKSILIEHENDPLNVSLSDDYPMKKRKTKIPTPLKRTEEASASAHKSLRRVTFHQDVILCDDSDDKDTRSDGNVTGLPDVERVTIKEECATIDVDEDEQTKFGQTILTDPSVFIIEESDMLANESNISFVGSPPSEQNHRGSTLKFDNTYYEEYVNLTLHVNQTTNSSCIVISDDSLTVANNCERQNSIPPPLERRLTMEDLPERIKRTRESLVMNSTVASEVMYELNQQIIEAKKACCSFQGNCNCRHRRTMAVVKRDNVELVRESWNQNFDRILSSVSDLPVHIIPLDDRILEVLNRPMKPLPLPCLEKQKPYLPELPPLKFLCENYLICQQADNTPSVECSPCDLPATPSVTALICNKLRTENYRWFLDTTDEHDMRLYLRHRVLRSIRFKIQLQNSRRWYSKQEDTRIIRIELIENPSDLVDSTRLLVSHLELVRAMNKTAVDLLSSQYPSTAHIMGLIVHIDTLVEQTFGKVDQLYRIVRNNGAILEQIGDSSRLQIDKFYEYQHEGVIHWNRIYVQFDSIDRIDHHSVIFHRKMINAACLLPTEHQCGKIGIHGLTFLECLLWNVEKISID